MRRELVHDAAEAEEPHVAGGGQGHLTVAVDADRHALSVARGCDTYPVMIEPPGQRLKPRPRWLSAARDGRRLPHMCRNITELRGLEPPASREEIEAAAKQYVRKVTGVTRPNVALADRFEAAAGEIAAITEQLLDDLPVRRQPPKTVPPLRRPEVRERLGLAPFPA